MADFFNFLGQLLRTLIPPSVDSWQTVFWLVIFIFVIWNLVFNLAIKSFILSLFGLDGIFKALKPPKPDSWQTLLLISIFSWAMALLPESVFVQAFIATCAWFFLIPGVHWFLHEEKFKFFGSTINVKKGLTINDIWLGPWITGALVCMLLFSELPENRISVGFICWPPISAIIAALPKFIAIGPHYKTPDPGKRQELVILLLTNLLLSCWFQLFFVTQSWLIDYPSLLTQDFSRSAFVVKFASNRSQSRGVTILDQAETIVREQLDGKPWSQAERWLFDLKPSMQQVEATVMEQLPPVKENELWHLDGQVLPGTEYQLQMMAVWQGPSADGSGYYVMKPCQITRMSDPRRSFAQTVTSTQIARVTCDTATAPKAGQPDRGT
jgi:Family of unknown function (DUF5357)